jgi:hypothetical protein
MTIQLIGAGLGRTGTMSLKLALEQLLGGTCHHMMEVGAHPDEIPVWDDAMRGRPVDWHDLLDGYTAIVDYPGAALWRDLAGAFPDAPILLSTRSSARTWYESAAATIFETSRRPPTDDQDRRHKAMIVEMLESSLGASLDDADALMAAYDAHNAAVRAEVPAERLFEYRPGDGWTPLCAALGIEIPEVDFPHVNTRDQFRSRAGLDA